MSDQYKTVDKFDRMLGELLKLPDVTEVKASTVREYTDVIGAAQTFIVHTLRQRERGDWIFLEYIDDQGSKRIYLPPSVSECIARQRDALTTKVRKRAAKAQAAQRKARGEVPAFMKGKKTKAKGGDQ